jgi:hypothetical protein
LGAVIEPSIQSGSLLKGEERFRTIPSFKFRQSSAAGWLGINLTTITTTSGPVRMIRATVWTRVARVASVNLCQAEGPANNQDKNCKRNNSYSCHHGMPRHFESRLVHCLTETKNGCQERLASNPFFMSASMRDIYVPPVGREMVNMSKRIFRHRKVQLWSQDEVFILVPVSDRV